MGTQGLFKHYLFMYTHHTKKGCFNCLLCSHCYLLPTCEGRHIWRERNVICERIKILILQCKNTSDDWGDESRVLPSLFGEYIPRSNASIDVITVPVAENCRFSIVLGIFLSYGVKQSNSILLRPVGIPVLVFSKTKDHTCCILYKHVIQAYYQIISAYEWSHPWSFPDFYGEAYPKLLFCPCLCDWTDSNWTFAIRSHYLASMNYKSEFLYSVFKLRHLS